MNENLRALYAAADADESLARELASLLGAPNGAEPAALAALARDHGVEVSEDDARALLGPAPADGLELAESELEAVAAGVVHCSSGARFLLG